MNNPVPVRPPVAIAVDEETLAAFAIRKHIFFLLVLLALLPFLSKAQSVSEIITSYNGYWKSSTTSVNPVKPDNSHNLLAFTYNGTRYSTGVNDALLTSHCDNFIEGDYSALPVSQITGTVNSNTKIGLGASYDGVSNGASNPAPENNIVKYLTDGVKGLDLGTCVANLPAGSLVFNVSHMNMSAVGDGIPDLLITQVADPSTSSLDSYEFTDANGNRIGNKIDIVLNNLSVVGNWTVDFYEASAHPMTLSAGYTRTDRPIRLWAADFSTFGITPANINNVAYFKITLNGNSDVAFVAYNNKTVSVSNPLAIRPSGQASAQTTTASQKITLYPNPAVNTLKVTHPKADNNELYQVVNMQGITMLQQHPAAGSTETYFDVQGLPKGAYLLTWNNGRKQRTDTFIKQ